MNYFTKWLLVRKQADSLFAPRSDWFLDFQIMKWFEDSSAIQSRTEIPGSMIDTLCNHWMRKWNAGQCFRSRSLLHPKMLCAAIRLCCTAEWNNMLRPLTSPGAQMCGSSVRRSFPTAIGPWSASPRAAIPSGNAVSHPVASSTASPSTEMTLHTCHNMEHRAF